MNDYDFHRLHKGSVSFFIKPSQIQVTQKDYSSNGVEFVSYGYQPEIKVPQSLDYVVLLKKALDLLKI